MRTKTHTRLALDIDDTLAETNLYWATQLAVNGENLRGYAPKELIREFRYLRRVPWLQREDIEHSITTMLRAEDHLLAVPPVVGAFEAVRWLSERGELGCYLTSRPRAAERGTRQWLSQNGFPAAPVFLHPDATEAGQFDMQNGNVWKASMLRSMYPGINGAIDDNDELPPALFPGYQGRVYLYSHQESKTELAFVVPCPTWEDVLAHRK